RRASWPTFDWEPRVQTEMSLKLDIGGGGKGRMLDLSEKGITSVGQVVAILATLDESSASPTVAVELNLDGNELVDLAGVDEISGLHLLRVGYNRLVTLGHLHEAPSNSLRLQELDVSGNALQHLVGVEACRSLSRLEASHNSLRNLPDLRQLVG
ncbi:unnamed protein product, partial [Discosporangium mesarthrocarpum]